MFSKMKKFVVGACLAVTALVTANVASVHAALAPADEALITAGLSASDAIFYKIGGAILVVLAGIWGFKKVKSLISA